MSEGKPRDDLDRLALLAEALDETGGANDLQDAIDLTAWAADVARRVKEKAKSDKATFHGDLSARARAGAARLAARRPEPIRPRAEQLVILAGLVERLGPRAVSVHFYKYEGTSDADLARIIGELRALEDGEAPGDDAPEEPGDDEES